jgi:hypothetical protein
VRASAALAVLLALGGAAAAEREDNPLTRMVPREDGRSACFTRTYDAAHLKRIPRQKTQSITLSLRFEQESNTHIVRIMLRQKDRPTPLHVVGGCNWSDEANLGVDGKPLMKEFTKASGLDCHVSTGLNSDEESGDFPIDLPEDGKSLTAYLFDRIAAWTSTDQRKKTVSARLGSEDLIFRLDRTDTAACHAMERALRAR